MISFKNDDVRVMRDAVDEAIFQLKLRSEDVHPANPLTKKAIEEVILDFERVKAVIDTKL